MIKKAFVIFFMASCFLSFSQAQEKADFKRLVYQNEVTGGIMFHTRGYGLTLRRQFYKNGYNKNGWEIDLVNIRHPKEVKFPNQLIFNPSRSFVDGKINSLYSIRVGYGNEKILVDKTDQGSVSISWILYGGLSLGILKPIYLEVLTKDNTLSVERYDPEVHPYSNIYGQASFFTGLGNSKLVPGLYLKSGFNFDYTFFDEKITTLETGVIVDFFPTYNPTTPSGVFTEGVPIMYDTENYNFWFQFYVTFNFGTKWN